MDVSRHIDPIRPKRAMDWLRDRFLCKTGERLPRAEFAQSGIFHIKRTDVDGVMRSRGWVIAGALEYLTTEYWKYHGGKPSAVQAELRLPRRRAA